MTRDDRFNRALSGLMFNLTRLDVDAMPAEILTLAIDLTEAERGFVAYKDQDGSLNQRPAVHGLDQDPMTVEEDAVTRVVNFAALSGQTILTDNTGQDARFQNQTGVESLIVRSIIAVPLKTEGTIFGVLYVDRRLRTARFDQMTADRLRTFTEKAVAPLYYAWLLAVTDAPAAFSRAAAALNTPDTLMGVAAMQALKAILRREPEIVIQPLGHMLHDDSLNEATARARAGWVLSHSDNPLARSALIAALHPIDPAIVDNRDVDTPGFYIATSITQGLKASGTADALSLLAVWQEGRLDDLYETYRTGDEPEMAAPSDDEVDFDLRDSEPDKKSAPPPLFGGTRSGTPPPAPSAPAPSAAPPAPQAPRARPHPEPAAEPPRSQGWSLFNRRRRETDAEQSAKEESAPPEPAADPAPIPAAPQAARESSARSPVQFSAYHPKTVRPDDWQAVYAYVFREAAASAVVADAFQQLGKKQAGYSTVTQPARAAIPEGAVITATPSMPGFQFNPVSASIGFYDDWARFDFKLRAKDAALNQFATGTITFTLEGVIVADVPLSLYVGEAGGDPEINGVITRLYQAIFCSYSHADTQIVERVERAYKALGLDYLRDVTTLRSGTHWSDELYTLIDKADIFQLFWSQTAADSKYVRQEWEYALRYEKDRPNFIRPVWWKQPMATVPPELGHIHFAYQPDLDDDLPPAP